VGDPNSMARQNHPDWLLPGTSHGALLDEGNPDARKWLTEHVSGMIKSQGIDWYREDMNGAGPLPPGVGTMRRTAGGHGRISTCRGIWPSGRVAPPPSRPAVLILRVRRPPQRPGIHARAVRCCAATSVPTCRASSKATRGAHYGLSFWLPFSGQRLLPLRALCVPELLSASFGMGR